MDCNYGLNWSAVIHQSIELSSAGSFSSPCAQGVSDFIFSYACMPAKFSDSDEVVFAFPKLFADLLKKDLRRTFAQASEVFNVFGNDDDSNNKF